MTTIELVLAGVYFLGVLGSLVFVIRRLVSVPPWEGLRRWPEGAALLLQHLMLVGFGCSAAAGMLIRQNYPGRLVITLGLMLGFSGAVWWLTFLQERAQRARHSQHAEVERELDDTDPDALKEERVRD